MSETRFEADCIAVVRWQQAGCAQGSSEREFARAVTRRVRFRRIVRPGGQVWEKHGESRRGRILIP